MGSPNLKEWLILLCIFVFIFLCGFGYGRDTTVKQCATILGLKPISSTADTCTYVRNWGLAEIRRQAI